MRREHISISEISRVTGLSRPTVRARLHRGVIPGLTTLVGVTKVMREKFEKWWKTQQK